MSADSTLAPLTLVHSAVAAAADTATVTDWRERALAVWHGSPTEREHQQRGLAGIMFSEVPCDPAGVCQATPTAQGPQRFRDAGAASQSDLADAALRGLLDEVDPQALRRCKLALYGTASVDDHFYRSTLSALAAAHGFAAVPHLGLAQLQGATLAAAAEVAEALLAAPGDAALFVAADAWPLPLPRVWDGLAPLGDGAAALWFVRGRQAGLQYVGGQQASFDPFVHAELSGMAPTVDRAALFEAARSTVEGCLAGCGIDGSALGVWIESGLDLGGAAGLDDRLRTALGAQRAEPVAPALDDGYLCAAAAPALLARTLERGRAGAWPDGTLVLGWGASLGGGIGVSLWRVCAPLES